MSDGPPIASGLPQAPADGTHDAGDTGPVGRPAGLRGATVVLGRAVLQVLPAWVVARVVVTLALVVARTGASTLRPGDPGAVARAHQGLLAWDAGWYHSIADHGYVGAGRESVRFFPLFPLLGRCIGDVPGVGTGAALVLVANLSALLAMAALWLLVRHDLGDTALARRSVWLLALAPSGYALVLAYSDALLLLCSVVTVLGARTGRWWWAAAAGLAAGLDRPVGVLLLVPVAVEVWLQRRDPVGAGGWSARIAALVAPVAGAGAYLAWVGHRFGDPWLPLTVQQQDGHRGRLAVPLRAMGHDVWSALHGHHLGSALHIPWIVLCLALVVVAWRRLPTSYAALATAVLVVSLSSSNLDSFERYALGAFPLVVAASTCTARRRMEQGVLVLSGLVMAGYAILAFVGAVVP